MENAAKESAAEQEARLSVKHHVAQTLIEAMQKGETPWQRPWSSVSMKPVNATTANGYRGVNRVLLALQGRSDNRWVTYEQARAKGWQVRRGEKGTMIVKVVDIEPRREAESERGAAPEPGEKQGSHKAVALRRYFVFNAEQVDGMPPLEQGGELEFDPVERAEATIAAMKEMTGLKIIHGGNQACYRSDLDEVRLPAKKRFHSTYDLYGTALHECCHATMAPARMNRREAYANRWGDEAYALEELTVEIAAAVLCSELGISDCLSEEQRAKHLAGHAAYLQSWIKVLQRDPLAIFTAAKSAERITEYVLGLERQMAAREEHKEWLADHDAAPER